MRRILADKSGNFGLFTALLAPVIIGAAGLAIDMSQALLAKEELQGIADSAVLSVVSQSGSALTEAYSRSGDGELTLSGEKMKSFFRSQAADSTYAAYFNSVKIKVVKKDGKVTAQLTYRAAIPTSLLAVLGKSEIPVAGYAEASSTLQSYRDFYLLLDNSPSMGVAATPQEIARMEAVTGGCAFACHTTADAGSNTIVKARASNITLRIDALKDAVSSLIAVANQQRAFDRQYRIAMYHFGESISSATVTKFVDLDYPSKKLIDASEKLELMTLQWHGERGHMGSAIYKSIKSLGDIIDAQGDGLAPATAKKTILIVTDGVEDSDRRPCSKPISGSGSCQEPLNADVCETLKTRGIDVAVMYTTYLPLPNDGWYRQWIQPFQKQIGEQLEKCASPGMFIEASFNHDMSQQLNTLFQRTLGSARLTQ